jgi:hypothetical protein
MKKVFIVHGFKSEPNGGWRPWLMGKLAKRGIYACALPMPAPSDPQKDEWIKTIKNSIGMPSEDIFLVGHSLGVPTILHYLETLKKSQKIGGAVLVSGPAFEIKRPGYAKVNKFLNRPFDFKHIKNVCRNFIIIHGDNDILVPFSHAEHLSKNLSGELVSVSGGGHLSGHNGCYKLPQLLKSLEKIL